MSVAEVRIIGERKPRVNLCGDCGDSIAATELLCEDCRKGILWQDAGENLTATTK
jgi:hypothetical protein